MKLTMTDPEYQTAEGVGRKLTKEEVTNLKGDIENFLLTKNIVIEIKMEVE